jgi:hypothetical protein
MDIDSTLLAVLFFLAIYSKRLYDKHQLDVMALSFGFSCFTLGVVSAMLFMEILFC